MSGEKEKDIDIADGYDTLYTYLMALADFKLFDTVAKYLVTAVLLFVYMTTGALQAASVSCKVYCVVNICGRVM